MNIDQTCNSSFWTKEEDKIFENTLAIYFNDNNLFMKMEEALPGKSLDDIKDHYNILLEDIGAIDSGDVPLPNYPKMQRNVNQNTKHMLNGEEGLLGQTRNTCWSFLRVLDIYGKGDWKSITRHCVITRTAMQVATPAQKYFKRVEANNKGIRRARAKPRVLDIISVNAEFGGTSQVPNTVDMIGLACGGSQAVPNSSNESMFPRESTNAEHMTIVVGGELSGQNVLVNVDTSSGTSGHSISRVGNNDISLIFDVGKAPTADAGITPTAHTEMSGYAAAGEAPAQLPPFTPSSYFGDGPVMTWTVHLGVRKSQPDGKISPKAIVKDHRRLDGP
ncbi:hypothetical protein H5410_045563 [Solanum commersonii]|uniref:Myb-like domain-containing protein n=1 Tax=Solanum commersonii TaxID=4109 RepID=A0A9J5X9W1_SOLCO|nr:hypothetical protein H5410_045563 [Solanum commersonii]